MSLTYNKFKSTTIYGTFNNSDDPITSANAANATFNGSVNCIKGLSVTSGITSDTIKLGTQDLQTILNNLLNFTNLTLSAYQLPSGSNPTVQNRERLQVQS